jgi:hypothetical protein
MATVGGESKCGNVMQSKNKKKQRIESVIAQGEAVAVKTASSGNRTKRPVICKEDVERVKN